MSIMDRFRGVLGNETVDEFLEETELATNELDAAGTERKAIDEPVDETPPAVDAPEEGDVTEAGTLEDLVAFIDERIGKALEAFAGAVADETTKAIDERAELLARIDGLETMVIEVEDEYAATRDMLPRHMQAARLRASGSKSTTVENANAPAPPEQGTFALGTLAVDMPEARR